MSSVQPNPTLNPLTVERLAGHKMQVPENMIPCECEITPCDNAPDIWVTMDNGVFFLCCKHYNELYLAIKRGTH